ncbi:MAG: N-formylglutamate amidohydrolase [Betaproteobacteria bacterium]|nr:N-formylglutamate amidohydrolase [Betaproteobacteria bacterium]
MSAPRNHYLITCEHGGNRVPEAYRALFAGHEELLATHRGWDPGALTLARDLARALDAPLYYATVSRLVIDLNRSIGHPRLYGEATRGAPRALRREILARHYMPYRTRVERHIRGAVADGRRVVHVSTHSFTPVLNGQVRQADVGLLYDPARPAEAALARLSQGALKSSAQELRVRRNYPYSGRSDGFTAYLRRCFPATAYAGIELEINQKQVSSGRETWRELKARLIAALMEVLTRQESA